MLDRDENQILHISFLFVVGSGLPATNRDAIVGEGRSLDEQCAGQFTATVGINRKTGGITYGGVCYMVSVGNTSTG